MFTMSGNLKSLYIFLSIIIIKVGVSSPLQRVNRINLNVKLKNNSSILDTGRGNIGIFLSKSVRNLRPLREHYYWKIHHHFHNRDDALQDINVMPKDITLCEDGAGAFCPKGSVALCTKNSAVRCLTSLWETEICDNSIYSHCASIYLPCNMYIPECRDEGKQYFKILSSCIAVVNVYANLKHFNGTIAARNLIKVYPPNYFCEIVLALPAQLTKGEELFARINEMFGKFAVRALDIN
ncbi:unnamed protein product [Phyllotreta striolata]|uniref:Uncharacterized protein n=1 Tax=Phyllotreta striolata TaxID=444603 RepID=A0A9N9TE96_PHYSR|nr:unnamed protein product [Phyllotreta striolata]